MKSNESVQTSIRHIPGKPASRGVFELTIEGKRRGFLQYSLPDDGTIALDYVEVSPELNGKGFGAKLVGEAVSWARAHKRQVEPHCSFARAVMARTKEFQDVLKR